jgi:hypothetical protein
MNVITPEQVMNLCKMKMEEKTNGQVVLTFVKGEITYVSEKTDYNNISDRLNQKKKTIYVQRIIPAVEKQPGDQQKP